MGNSAKSLTKDVAFQIDMARFADQILSEKQIRQKYHLVDEPTWVALAQDESLLEAIELARVQRLRSGATKRELAQNHVAAAPGILNDLMKDPRVSPRHRVDAIRTLDSMSDTGPDSPPARDVFQITINLGGGDVLRFGGSRAPTPNETNIIERGNNNIIEHDNTTTDTDNDDDDDIPRWLPITSGPKDSGAGGAPSW